MAPIARKAAPAQEGVNFLSLDMYKAGGGLPEGDYMLTFNIVMHSGFGQQTSNLPPRLGVMIDCVSLDDPSAEPRKQFYSMGSNADKSFAPSPDGKGLIAVPGGPAQSLNDQTNWAMFNKSLYDAGLPENLATNNFEVIDGIHVHMANVSAPEARKSFKSTIGEAAGLPNDQNRPQTVAIVTEIKDDGKPWEGTGGVPVAGKKAAPKAAVKAVAGKPVAAVAKAKAAPVAAAAAPDDDVEAVAQSAAGEVFEKSPNGLKKAMFRMGVFKHIKATSGDDMAQAVQETFFATDEALDALLAPLGYQVNGHDIVAL